MVCPSKPPCRFDPKVANPAQAESRRFINLENALGRAHISTVTLRFSPSFGSSPVNLALANSNAAMVALAGPSHNSAAKGAINKWHTWWARLSALVKLDSLDLHRSFLAVSERAPIRREHREHSEARTRVPYRWNEKPVLNVVWRWSASGGAERAQLRSAPLLGATHGHHYSSHHSNCHSAAWRRRLVRPWTLVR